MSWQDDAREIYNAAKPGTNYWPYDSIAGVDTGEIFTDIGVGIGENSLPLVKEACEQIVNSIPRQPSQLFQKIKDLATDFMKTY